MSLTQTRTPGLITSQPLKAAAFELSPEPAMVISADGALVAANDAAEAAGDTLNTEGIPVNQSGLEFPVRQPVGTSGIRAQHRDSRGERFHHRKREGLFIRRNRDCEGPPVQVRHSGAALLT